MTKMTKPSSCEDGFFTTKALRLEWCTTFELLLA